MVTNRVKKMKDQLQIAKYPLCVEKMRFSIEAMKKAFGKPLVVRRAQELANILDNITIFIEEGDLIAGSGASKPFGIEMDYEFGGWTRDEVGSLKAENYAITPEDEKELYSQLEQMEKKNLSKSLTADEGAVLGSINRLWLFAQSGITPNPFRSIKTGAGGGKAVSSIGLGPALYIGTIQYERILKYGAGAIIDEARECLKNHTYHTDNCIKNKEYWESIIQVYEAWIRYAHRFACLAEEMSIEERDVVRKKELLQMAEICRRVPEYPARSFREAIQAFWFTFLLTISPVASAGRFDQYMYPYYKEDLESGAITREEALELLEILRIKDMKLNRVSGKVNREKNEGMAKWHNFTIGGVDKDGRDVTNDITYLLMEAARDTQLPHHTISLRVHEDSPLEVIVKALEVVKTGLGMPAFFSDKSFINYFTNHNCDIEDARDYCIAGCVDGAIPGKTRGLVGPQILVPQILDVFLHNGVSRHSHELVGIATGDTTTFETFDEFIAAFYKQLDYIIGLAAETANIGLLSSRNLTPDPFYSALMDDGVKSGLDIKDRTLKFDNALAILPIGTVNATDSIAAIKILIYEQKKYTMKELVDALDNNWEGKDDMRKDFVTAPKYGNNHPVPDQVITDFYQHFYLRCNEITHANGGPVTPSGLSVTSHQPGGKLVKASPDGRKAGDILAEGSVSPIQGKDVNGPLAVLQSAMKINQDPYQATLLNMKFHPSALKTEEDLYKLAMTIKTYLTNGGKHVQFNVVNKETLIMAKKEPDKHNDLVVRVAGYSAYFTMLSPMVQDEVINRTTFDGV